MSFTDIKTEHSNQAEKLRKQTTLKQNDVLYGDTAYIKNLPHAHTPQNSDAFTTLVKKSFEQALRAEKASIAQENSAWYSWSQMIHTASVAEIHELALKSLTLRVLGEQKIACQAKLSLEQLHNKLEKAETKLHTTQETLEIKQTLRVSVIETLNDVKNKLLESEYFFEKFTHVVQAIDPTLELPETRSWHDLKNLAEWLNIKNDSLEAVKTRFSATPDLACQLEEYLNARATHVTLKTALEKSKASLDNIDKEVALAVHEARLAEIQHESAQTAYKLEVEHVQEKFHLESIDKLNQYIALKEAIAHQYLSGGAFDTYIDDHPAAPPIPIAPPPAPIHDEHTHVKPYFD